MAGAAAAVVAATQMAGTVGYLVAKELGTQAFAFTVSRLGDILTRLSQHESDIGKAAHVQLARLIPTAKLNITRALMSDFDGLRAGSKTLDALLQAINDAAETIMGETHAVENKIDEHRRTVWFASWRSLDLSEHVERVRAAVVVLDANFALVTQLLPSCVVAMAAARQQPAPRSCSSASLSLIPLPPPLSCPTNRSPSSLSTERPASTASASTDLP